MSDGDDDWFERALRGMEDGSADGEDAHPEGPADADTDVGDGVAERTEESAASADDDESDVRDASGVRDASDDGTEPRGNETEPDDDDAELENNDAELEEDAEPDDDELDDDKSDDERTGAADDWTEPGGEKFGPTTDDATPATDDENATDDDVDSTEAASEATDGVVDDFASDLFGGGRSGGVDTDEAAASESDPFGGVAEGSDQQDLFSGETADDPNGAFDTSDFQNLGGGGSGDGGLGEGIGGGFGGFDGGGGDDTGFAAPEGSSFDDEEEFDSDIDRIDVGIRGLDEMILGGVPERSLMVAIGSAGTGKTTFGLQFLTHALRNDGKAVYITLEESRDAILSTAEEKGWPFREWCEEDRLAVVALDPIEMANSLASIRSDISRLVTDFGADRLVLDSVSLLEMMYDHPATRRSEVFDFARSLKQAGVTTMLTSEASDDNAYTSRYGIVEYLVDAVFILQYVRPSNFRETRLAVEIQKIRDANHSRETKPYEITNKGISVYRQANIF